MIHVDRNSVQPPAEWTLRAREETKRVIEYFSQTEPSQTRFHFHYRLWAEVQPLLMNLFRDKCAFCETYTAGPGATVEHFRPHMQVQDIADKGIVSRGDGYYWLAYDWENLYLACHACSQNKRNYFPVEGLRAAGPRHDLDKEKPLLLDPCLDDPEKYLQFDEDGTLLSLHPRGAVTIKVLGLNRESLVEARAGEIRKLRYEISILLSQSGQRLAEELERLTHLGRPYAGMRRQLIAKYVSAATVATPDLIFLKKIISEVLQPELDILQKIEESPSIAPEVVPSLRTGYIKSIEIRNFKAIKNVKLNFSESREQASWKMLLGENAAGKSTVLKAVALALMGEEYAKSMFKRDQLLNSNAKNGYVRVELFTDSDPIEFTFTKKKLTFRTGSEGGNLFVRAYGATRLLPREISPSAEAKDDQTIHEELKRVDNLFDPFTTLCDAEKWLSGLDEDAFNSAGLTFKDLVQLDVEEALSRTDSEVRLDIGDGPLPLEQQSAGYQAVLAIATDIMAGIRDIHDKQQASGIVLLDEIDAHLHPRWKMRIVKSLREAFKNIQFLATTHEPLCLRGLSANEIALMKREGSQIIVKDNLPSPAALRVDQLLTSDLFGLYSTIDPDVEAKFNEYYALLAKRNLTDEELTRCNILKAELEPHGALGYTRRDQLIYEVIDEYLAKDLITTNSDKRMKLRAETKKKVADIWRRVNTQRGAH